jgi:putative tryptophan/tyrosine transport system substrate-binding protein
VSRRDLITLLCGAAVWMSPAGAQERPRVIGFLSSISAAELAPYSAAFFRGLQNTREGRNASIEYRFADGRYDRLPSLAAELVGLDVAVIVSPDAPSASAARAATRNIPIVFLTGADPIKLGLVDSFNRPGSNLTGVSVLISALGPKRLELLDELLPTATTIVILVNPDNPNILADAPETQAAADALKRHLVVLKARTESDLEAAFMTMVQQKASGLIVMPDPFFIARRGQLVALAARHAMPTIYPIRDFAEVGGLMSYGSNLLEGYRLTGVYAGKILDGAKPADLPIQQSARFEFLINLKTAKTLGLAIPPSLLARADEVIE